MRMAEYGRSVSGRNRAKVCVILLSMSEGIETWWQISAAHIGELSVPRRGENYFFKA